MHIEGEILKEHSKHQTLTITAWIWDDKKRFKQLMELFLRGEYRVVQRSAWIITYCNERNPGLITPWLLKMIRKAEEPGVHDAVKRNVLRILRTQPIPHPLLGIVTKICFDHMSDASSPVAVRVHAM